MAFYDKFPYTNFQELNLDKIVEKIGDIDRAEEASAQSAVNAANSANAAQAAENAAEAAAADAESSKEAAHTSEVNAAATAYSLEQLRGQVQTNTNRIDNILVQGTPTEGNAELIDIRVGANGVTYPTAGDAVRGQYRTLQSQMNHPETKLTQLMIPYYFTIENGDEITVHSADGANMTPAYLRLYNQVGTRLTEVSLSGWSTPSRTIIISIAEPAVYMQIEGGTRQDILVENNTRLLGHDFYTQVHQQAVYDAEKALNVDTIEKPYSFYGKPDDVCVIETVSGANFTPTTLRLFYGDGTTGDYALHDYYTNRRYFTVSHTHGETPLIGIKIMGGTAQELRLYNYGTRENTVLKNNMVYSIRINADENEKMFAFRFGPGEKAYIKTVNGSNFTINRIGLYDRNGKYMDAFALEAWGVNQRALELGSLDVYYVALLDGTPQDVILELSVWKDSVLTKTAETIKAEMPPASLFNSSDVLYHIDPIEKATEFSSLSGSGTDTESFIYFTDPHTYQHNDDMLSAVYLQTLIQKYYHSTPTDFVMCGGDWLQDSDTRSEAKYKLGLIQASMEAMCEPYYPVLGNHDDNSQGVDDSGDPNTGILDNGVITNLWFRKYGRNYYSFDGTNTRFYVFDSGSDGTNTMNPYRWQQIAWFANALTSETHPHIAVSIHIWWNGEKAELANNLTSLINAYNNRQSISLNGVSYNYSNATGRIEFVISGHMHEDRNEALGSGVPVIATINAGYGNNTFDMIYADYNTRLLYCIRVGVGNNRTFSLNTGQLQ